MGKKYFPAEQIAFALKHAESGNSMAEIIRKLGISEQTFYRRKKRLALLGIAELRRLRTPEKKNHKRKQRAAGRVAERRACRVLGVFPSDSPLPEQAQSTGRSLGPTSRPGVLPGAL